MESSISITVGLAIIVALGSVAYYYAGKAVEEKQRRERKQQ